MLAPTLGQDRRGRGKPIRKIGRQNKGRRGADKAAADATMASSTGRKSIDNTRMATVDGCLCLGSVQEVTVRVTRKDNLFASC